jgi:hypothetical protein
VACLELGDVRAFAADLDAMEQLADELRQPGRKWLVTVYQALLALLEGRLEEAEQLVAAARVQGELVHGWSAGVTYRLQLYVLRREQGRLDEVAELVRAAPREYPTYPVFRCVAAHLEGELGEHAAARAALDALAADGFAALPFDEEWLVGMCLLAETAARVGAADHGGAIHGLLLPYVDRIAVSYPEIAIGSVARHAALAALAAGGRDEARTLLAHAIAIEERIGARPGLARSRSALERLQRDGRRGTTRLVT